MIDFSNVALNSSEPVYIQLVLHVKKQIAKGTASSGDSLPSRRELAAMLEINPNTVQKAYRLMEQEGFVVTEGNTGSVLNFDSHTLNLIREELTKGMVRDFISNAKELNLSFKQTIDLVSDVWDEV